MCGEGAGAGARGDFQIHSFQSRVMRGGDLGDFGIAGTLKEWSF